ncbi:MAG TPA: hypothetical protein VKG25_25815 [Bryobacteraceae bacterium]|nr:hypothetical protein [Bryobacteraceae bacterium]
MTKTLLEHLCEHVVSFQGDQIEVERKDSVEWVYARIDNANVKIATFPSSSSDGKELRANLAAALKKPMRRIFGGQVYVVSVEVYESSGEDAFRVGIGPAPKLDPLAERRFTAKQGQYLAFIYNYTKIHGRAPAESDLQEYFRVAAPSIHQMILTLQVNGLIDRTPGQARSIRLLVPPEQLPRLG